MRVEFIIGIQTTHDGRRIEDEQPKCVASLRLVLGTEFFHQVFMNHGVMAGGEVGGPLLPERALVLTTDTTADYDTAWPRIQNLAQRLAQLWQQESVQVWVEREGTAHVSANGSVIGLDEDEEDDDA